MMITRGECPKCGTAVTVKGRSGTCPKQECRAKFQIEVRGEDLEIVEVLPLNTNHNLSYPMAAYA